MKLFSLIRDNDRLVPAEVEVLLLPGLPQIHVLGLPDQVIRESLHRVRSALRSQGFEWPRARQVLVNIRPVDLRKSSRGLELAIAAGLIWEMAQKKAPLMQKGFYVYGELSLSGEVKEPEDLALDFTATPGDLVLTGAGTQTRGFARDRVMTLMDLDRPVRDEATSLAIDVQRPSLGLSRFFTKEEARVISIAAVGGHHVLLAGASGGGKTTVAKSLRSFLAAPSDEDLRQGKVADGWRPWVAPHHSTSCLSLIGGGVPPRPGEISKADGGVLFLDELLEFSPAAQEALREPVEEGMIRISRGMRSKTFPARLQLIGTTNLCPCGRWVPGARVNCARSWKNCRSVLERISGPFFDRFDILAFALGGRVKREVEGQLLLAEIEVARSFREHRQMGTEDNNNPDLLWSHVEEPWRTELKDSDLFSSERRRISTLRVARTLADIESSHSIRGAHVDEALQLCLRSFESLRSGGPAS
jgi:magnesium chelatase family protein